MRVQKQQHLIKQICATLTGLILAIYCRNDTSSMGHSTFELHRLIAIRFWYTQSACRHQ